jgi:hypothetical protein
MTAEDVMKIAPFARLCGLLGRAFGRLLKATLLTTGARCFGCFALSASHAYVLVLKRVRRQLVGALPLHFDA